MYILGTRTNDWLECSYLADTIYGLSGHDTIFSNWGDDTVYGGAGTDWVFGNKGDDVLMGGDGNDLLRGEVGNDRLNGGQGNDSLSGGEGGDNLIPGGGNDTVDGGVGIDVACFPGSQASYRLTAQSDGSVQVAGRDGVAVVYNTEFLMFEYEAYVPTVLSAATLQSVPLSRAPNGGRLSTRHRAVAEPGAGLLAGFLDRYRDSRVMEFAGPTAAATVSRLNGDRFTGLLAAGL